MRLQRVGRKHEPSFRLVLTDSKNSTKSGRTFETLGSYDPRKNSEAFKTDRIKHWITKGISFTPSVNNLLLKHGIIRGKKVHVSTVPVIEPVAPAEEVQAPVAEEIAAPVVEETSAPEAEVTPEPAPLVEEAAAEAPAPTPEPETTPKVAEETPSPETADEPTA